MRTLLFTLQRIDHMKQSPCTVSGYADMAKTQILKSVQNSALLIIFMLGSCTSVQAQVPSVNAFYQNIVGRRQAVAEICSMGTQWNVATGGSYYTYLKQRIQEAWQRGDGIMVNSYKAEGLVSQRYCRGVF